MCDIEVFHFCHQGHYVAAAQFGHGSFFGQVGVFYVGEAVIAVSDFNRAHAFEFAIVGQCRIFTAVGAHKVDGAHLICHGGEIGGDFSEVAAMCVVDYPVADVMQSRCISVDFATAVSQTLQVVQEVAPGASAFAYGVRQRHDGFDECGAVEFVEIHSQHFGPAFEGVRHVWSADKAHGNVGGTLARGLETGSDALNEDFVYSRCVGFLVMEACGCRSGQACGGAEAYYDYCKQIYVFHGAKLRKKAKSAVADFAFLCRKSLNYSGRLVFLP